MVHTITQQLVVSRLDALPAFPKTVQAVLETVDDPDSSMATLAEIVGRDPAIAGRVLAAANKAAEGARRSAAVDDIYTATSLVGMRHVRDVAVLCSLGDFVEAMGDLAELKGLWRHSVGVGVCAQEMALSVAPQVSLSHALIAGLLHDIGQFWLLLHDRAAYVDLWNHANRSGLDLDQLEEAVYGVNHAQIGAWLAAAWNLPGSIGDAIAGHHRPHQALQAGPLIALLHVAEVVSNALELGGGSTSHVRFLSPTACVELGLAWDDGVRSLFGRIEARSHHVAAQLEA